MNISELDRLMHAVLDGEATPVEAAALDRQLAADPAARERFQDLKWLFEELHRVPQAFPPEGLVAAVVAAAPLRRPAGRQRMRQLFSRSRVIRLVSMGPRGTSSGGAARVRQVSQPGPQLRGYKMNEQKSGFIGKRTVWIGAGITAVAVVLVLQFVDFPPSGKDVSGTIAPAQRYRAAQPTAGDVQAGGQSGGQTGSPTDTGAVGANSGGANSGGANSGGANSGGANSGGANSGGANSGGANSGGANSGGANSGGANSGGANSGGANSGGANSGGANSGGANSGGANSGGANSGGANSGGANAGGAH
jgi:hypothetical protein